MAAYVLVGGAWLDEAECCGLKELRRFAAGIRKDEAAVRAALSTKWSNGQVEGHVLHRLKLLKRQRCTAERTSTCSTNGS